MRWLPFTIPKVAEKKVDFVAVSFSIDQQDKNL